MSASVPTPAIFLSYARDDAASARRVAEALRSSGLEVWFDENELRGGDAWDAKIRRQINDCALFVPLISRHTETRAKGYFRLEWKLAVEQTHLLADGVPFIAPVAIDDTREAGAVVPAEFLRVQWTRLPGALPTPQFVEQIKRLLAPAPAVESAARRSRVRTTLEAPVAPAPQSRHALWPWVALGVVLAGMALAMVFMGKGGMRATTKANDHSVAVLPFTNMSDDRENAYFADGIHEDILTKLTAARELRVVSRTTMMQYRTTALTMSQIGETLHVAYILEGSVRGRGSRVRVSVQLIDARTDEHVWAQSFDADLTDIFATQTDLASQIAAQLKATISPH